MSGRGRRRPARGPAGKPASSSSCGGQQRGQHGLGVGLGDDGVAGEERREAVAQRHRERVVPRRDDADDALGMRCELDPGERRDDAADAPGVEVLVRRTGVVARGQRDVQRLVEGVLAGLADSQQIRSMISCLAVEDQVVQAQQRGRARVDRGARPLLLGPAGPAERLVDVGLGRLRDVGQWLVVDRRADLDGRARRSPRGAGSGSRRTHGRGRTTRWGRARGRADPRRRARRRGAGRSCTESMSAPRVRLPPSNKSGRVRRTVSS